MIWIVLAALAVSAGVNALTWYELRERRKVATPANVLDGLAALPDDGLVRAASVMSRSSRKPMRPFRAHKSFREERAEFERRNNGRKDDREIGEAL